MARSAAKSGLRSFVKSARRGQAAVVAIATMLAGAAMTHAQHSHPRHKNDPKSQVERLEEVWRTAQLNDDVDAMDRLLSDDYIGITMNGQVVTKAQQLERMRSRNLVLSKVDLQDMKVKLTGPTAVVTGKAEVEGTDEGQAIHGTYRYMRVYMRTPAGAWKVTNLEVTRVGEPGAGRRTRSLEPSSVPGSGTQPRQPQQQRAVAGAGR